MTLSRETTQRSDQEQVSSPSIEQDGHLSPIGTILQETIPVDGPMAPYPEPMLVREMSPSTATTRRFGSAVRILFGLIWLADVYFKWQPSFLHRLPEVMSDGAKGQPGWLMPWFNVAQGVVAVHPTAWAYSIAIAETGIAVALILGIARKVTCVGGAIYSLMIWSTAEGLGRTSGVATDIGTAIIYAVVFLALLALDARGKGTRPYSLDAMIERRLPWWRRIAEVRM